MLAPAERATARLSLWGLSRELPVYRGANCGRPVSAYVPVLSKVCRADGSALDEPLPGQFDGDAANGSRPSPLD